MNTAAITPYQSIQRYLIVAFGIVAFLVFGIGGWASTIPLEGAVVAQGLNCCRFKCKKDPAPVWRHCQRNSR